MVRTRLWYDPTTNKFYVTGNNGTNATRFFDVVTDAALGGIITQTVDLPTTTSAHSITVDPFNGDVFVALAGTAGANGVNPCPATQANPGCIAVYAPDAGAGARQLAASGRRVGRPDGPRGAPPGPPLQLGPTARLDYSRPGLRKSGPVSRAGQQFATPTPGPLPERMRRSKTLT